MRTGGSWRHSLLRICQLPSPTLCFKQDKQVMTLKFQNPGGGFLARERLMQGHSRPPEKGRGCFQVSNPDAEATFLK